MAEVQARGHGTREAAGPRRALRLAPAAVLLASAGAVAAPGGDDPASSVSGASNEPTLVEDLFVETVVGSGSVGVSTYDGTGFAPGTHGQRVRDTYLAHTSRARLLQIEGRGVYEIDGDAIRRASTRSAVRGMTLLQGKGIFWTATISVPAYSQRTRNQWFFEGDRPLYKEARTFGTWFQRQDTLWLAALQNPNEIEGKPAYCDDFVLRAEGYWIPICGMMNDYAAHSGVGLDKMLFAGAITPGGRASSAIREHGAFERHTIFVESPDGSTSHAVAVLAAYATNLAFSNPGWDAATLKRELMKLAVEEDLLHWSGVTEPRVLKVIRPAFAPKGEPPSGQPPPEPPAGSCVADAETLCLLESRYAVTVEWRRRDGEVGPGRAVKEGTNDSGLFTFFDPNNWEILIKVLDACEVDGHVWVYGASTTDLGYTITVTETATGRVQRYSNEAGRPAQAITDARAFPGGCQASAGTWEE